MTDLKQCPFCKGHPSFQAIKSIEHYVQIICDSCDANVWKNFTPSDDLDKYFQSYQDAKTQCETLWNTRI